MKKQIDELEAKWTELSVVEDIDGGDPHNCKKRNSTWRVWDRLIHRGGYIKDWKHYENFYKDMGEKPRGAILKKKNSFIPHGTYNSFWKKNDEQRERASN